MNQKFKIAAVLAAIAALFAIRFSVLFYPDPYMIAAIKSDDAFYYCDLVMNYARQHSLSTDGINATNGFHPMYFGVLWLGEVLFAFTKAGLVRYALSVLLVAELISIAFLALLLKNIFGAWFKALLVTALYMAIPAYCTTILSGVEAGMYQMTAAIMLYCLYRILSRRCPATARDSFLIGLLLGLTALARTEAVLLFAAIAASECVYFRAPLRDVFSRWSALAAGSAIVLMPWLIWNFITFGTIRQDSMIANYLFFSPQRTLPQDVQHYWRMFGLTILGQYNGSSQNVPAIMLTGFWVAGILFLAWQGVRLALRRASVPGWQFQFGIVLLGYMVLHFLFYLWFGNAQTWYFTLPIFAAALLVAVNYSDFQLNRVSFICVVCVIGLVSGFYHQRNMQDLLKLGAKRAHEGRRWDYLYRVASDGKIASYNSGALSYFTDLRIVNLDGVINHAAAQAKAEGDLGAFIVSNDVRYIWDTEWFVSSNKKYYRDFDKLFRLSPKSPAQKNGPRLYERVR